MRVRTSPAEVLREEFMEPLGLSGASLAAALHVPANRINDILRDRRGITADTALRLGRYFGTSAEFWLNLQLAYDLSRVEHENGARIRAEVAPRVA